MCSTCAWKKSLVWLIHLYTKVRDTCTYVHTYARFLCMFELHDTLLGEDFWPDLLHWGLPWQRSWRCQAAKTRQTGTADRWGKCTMYILYICQSNQQNSGMKFGTHLHVVWFSGSHHKCTFCNPNLGCMNFRVCWNKSTLFTCSKLVFYVCIHNTCTWKMKIIVKWNLPSCFFFDYQKSLCINCYCIKMYIYCAYIKLEYLNAVNWQKYYLSLTSTN